MDTIVCIQPVGVNTIYDFEVPVFHNYVSSGCVHHNTESLGGYETVMHLTGKYPEWWEGKRFDRPVYSWACGSTGQTVRDILQFKLLGTPGKHGTGLIPRDSIKGTSRKAGNVPDAVENVQVEHKSGGTSILTFKSYDQGRKAFEGTERDWVWLDESPPAGVYDECLVRTMTTGGSLILTMTPLEGLTEVILRYMPDAEFPTEHNARWVIQITWDDAPHLSQKQKEQLFEATPLHLRDARSKGIPHLGAGVVYPVSFEDLIVEPFEIPPYWAVAYGMDVGWNRTAALWGAWDKDSDVLYLYSEHYLGQAEPPIHANAIQARGKWLRGVIDPAARGRSQVDGRQLMHEYIDMGLNLYPADNGVESGIYAVWTLLSSGRIKIFKTLRNLVKEMKVYRRDDNGKILKQEDHLCDAMRYLVVSGKGFAKSEYEHFAQLEYASRENFNESTSITRAGGYF